MKLLEENLGCMFCNIGLRNDTIIWPQESPEHHKQMRLHKTQKTYEQSGDKVQNRERVSEHNKK
jgi:hypothetical protein